MAVVDFEALARVRELAASGAARRLRLRAQLSLREMAGAVGDVSPSTIFRWEYAQRRPTGEPALRYLSVLERLRRVG